MGKDDFFKKKKAKLQERKGAYRLPNPNSFLIVSEGTKTEPLYFDGLASYINNKYSKNGNIQNPIIVTKGEGKCTVSLVNEASKIASLSHIIYEQVWIIFDKDDFNDFDEAITLAENHGFKVAWSNQSFEYWIYLHFHYSDSALHRSAWAEKLNKLFKERGISSDGYEKNNPNIFEISTTRGSLKSAINYAKKVEVSHNNVAPPSLCDPCTKVHHLILALKPFLDELL